MRVGVVTERSTAARNAEVVAALEALGHEVVNVGMTCPEDPVVNFIQCGAIGAMLLNYGIVDYVVGGCGNGQGYCNATMMFPNVFCGVIRNEIDGWLFTQINGGNCVSLVLGQEYGFGSKEKLGFILERLFSVEIGSGFPKERKEPQAELKKLLSDISVGTHKTMDECLMSLDKEFLKSCVEYKNFKDVFEAADLSDELRAYIKTL